MVKPRKNSFNNSIGSLENNPRSTLKFLYKFPDVKKVFDFLPFTERSELASKLELKRFEPGEVLFEKGSFPTHVYIVVSGSISLYTVTQHGEKVLDSVIKEGKIIGERSISRNRPHSVLCKANKNCWVFLLNSEDFKRFIMEPLVSSIDQRLEFIQSYIPGISKYSSSQVNRLVYAFRLKNYGKHKVIAKQGEPTSRVFILVEGSCIMVRKENSTTQNVAYLQKGSFIGEESVLFQEPSKYTVYVTSQSAKLYRIRGYEFQHLMPIYTQQILKDNYCKRDLERSTYLPRIKESNSQKDFKMASPRAIKGLILSSKLKHQSSKTSLATSHFKNILQTYSNHNLKRI